jgi:hypothetical protein
MVGRALPTERTGDQRMTNVVPDAVRSYTVEDVERQRINWIPDRWTATFGGHQAAYSELLAHSEAEGGITRSFIHSHTESDPVDLFLMAMAWGYKPKDYGPHRVKTILDAECVEDHIRAIVDATRTQGAAAGWHALLNTHKINGLNMSFGTKLLYFAGYTTEHRPRPLVLDEKVRASLDQIAPGTVPPKGVVYQADYLRYLDLAETWASNPSWAQAPDVVEFALFDLH